MADYSLNYGKAIGLSGQPKLATQIALERERRAAAAAEKEAARAAAQGAADQKRKADQFKVLSEEVTIKDPNKYHRLYLNGAKEVKRKYLEELVNSYQSHYGNAPNAMWDKTLEVQSDLANLQAASKNISEYETARNSGKVVAIPELDRIIQSGDLNDLAAWSSTVGDLKGVMVKDDEKNHIPLVSIERIPKIDTDEPFNQFSQSGNLKKNYIEKLGTTPFAKADGMSYYRDELLPNPEQIAALKHSLEGDRAWIANKLATASDDELFDAGVRKNDPNSINKFIQGKIDQEIQKRILPITDESRLHTPKPPAEKKEDEVKKDWRNGISGNGWSNGKIAWKTSWTQDGTRLFTSINTIGATGNPVQKWKDKNTVYDGVVVGVYDDPKTNKQTAAITTLPPTDVDALNEAYAKKEKGAISADDYAKIHYDLTKSKKVVEVPIDDAATYNQITDNFGDGKMRYHDYIRQIRPTLYKDKGGVVGAPAGSVVGQTKPAATPAVRESDKLSLKQQGAINAFIKKFNREPSNSEREKLLTKYK